MEFIKFFTSLCKKLPLLSSFEGNYENNDDTYSRLIHEEYQITKNQIIFGSFLVTINYYALIQVFNYFFVFNVQSLVILYLLGLILLQFLLNIHKNILQED